MYAALIQKLRNGFKKINDQQTEWFTICGSLLTLVIFSLSKFQLSYYTNIIFPLLAILTAQYISKLQQSSSRFFKILQNSITIILLVGGILLQFFYSPATPSLILLLIIAGMLFLLIALPLWLKVTGTMLALYRVGLASLVINLYINWAFYPDLLKYQSSTEAAFYINKSHPGVGGICMSIYAPDFEFYLDNGWAKTDSTILYNQSQPGILYITQEELDDINKKGIHYEMLKELNEFHVTMLTLKFVNKKTRARELKKHYLIKLL